MEDLDGMSCNYCEVKIVEDADGVYMDVVFCAAHAACTEEEKDVMADGLIKEHGQEIADMLAEKGVNCGQATADEGDPS